VYDIRIDVEVPNTDVENTNFTVILPVSILTFAALTLFIIRKKNNFQINKKEKLIRKEIIDFVEEKEQG
ncbi:MAG: hypothetical protein II309_06960, partial [Bacilli bacterium]|nr:hypothetical protein [Bacilli bacterium]